MLFLLVVAGAVLFLHDKQQTADLNKALDENAQLTQQLADKEAAFNGAQARMQQLSAQAASQAAAPAPQAARAAAPQPATYDSDSLDRPAYGSGGH